MQYEAISHITYNGRRYPAGSKLELSEALAAKLPVRIVPPVPAAVPEPAETIEAAEPEKAAKKK